MHFLHSDLRYQLIYLSLTSYGKQQNFSLTKRQSRFRELSTDETVRKQQQKTENAIPAATKKPQTLV